MSPTYERLALAVAGDRRVLELLEQVEPEQRQPNLLLGAIRLHGVATDDPGAALDWVVTHPDPVLDVLTTRFTQTNEAARCALLLPALAQVARGRTGRRGRGRGQRRPLPALRPLPVPLRRRRGRTSTSWATGPPSCRAGSSAVSLSRPRSPRSVGAQGSTGTRSTPPTPIDARWLESLVWPEHHDRAARLTAALATAAADPPRVVEGDFATGLAGLLDEVPAGLTTVVTHTAALAYVPPEVGDAVRRTCREAGAWRLGAEGQRVLPDLTAPGGCRPGGLPGLGGRPGRRRRRGGGGAAARPVAALDGPGLSRP